MEVAGGWRRGYMARGYEGSGMGVSAGIGGNSGGYGHGGFYCDGFLVLLYMERRSLFCSAIFCTISRSFAGVCLCFIYFLLRQGSGSFSSTGRQVRGFITIVRALFVFLPSFFFFFESLLFIIFIVQSSSDFFFSASARATLVFGVLLFTRSPLR